ncbi:MAG: cyclic nucleotide-binding domain-containing protein [Deltaproteobacteria bacterium]|nr:cyclic nucleotide-binding domain-containing protein [Candidatus Anaeroferrophillus wilburensis]MBN2888155.1 cyclic nucleotide-binding domain-containing protein [Deltaproteobacteria bacterium]
MTPEPLTTIDLKTTCPKITIFRFMEPGEWEVFSQYLEPVRYPAGSILYQEGEEGDFLVYIVSGRMEALKQSAFLGKPVILARFHAGSVVGEMAFVDGSKRSVTVKVMEDTELLVFSRNSYDRLLAAAPRVGTKLLNGIAHLLSLRLRRANERLATLF